MKLKIVTSLLFIAFAKLVAASSYVLPEKDDVVGEIQTVYAKSGETLSEVGRRYDVGYNEMLKANPRIDPTVRLFRTSKIVIPSQFILPPGPREGIVINLAELRLYYFPPNDNVVITEPVGIGRDGGWNTPIGTTKIVAKQIDPVWRPTPNVRTEAAKNGMPIPAAFPPGPNNPLGKYVLRLGWPTYLIHGTNRPEGVGARVSAGCVRMLPEDIEDLYSLVKVGTPVRVINEPIKVGVKNHQVYLEVHQPLKKVADNHLVNRAKDLISSAIGNKKEMIQEQILSQVVSLKNGMPLILGYN